MTGAVSPRECLKAYEAALVMKSLDGALSLMTDDVVVFFSNQSAHFGKDAFRVALKNNFDSIQDDNYATHDHVWLAEADSAAACAYSFAWHGKIEGKEVSGRGRGTTVLRRQSDGWLISHEHLSPGRWKPKA